MNARSERLGGVALLIVATVMWGCMFPIGKPILGRVDAFAITFVRYGISAVAIAALLAVSEGRAAFATEGRPWRLAFFGVAGFCGFSLLAFSGLRLSSPAHGSVVVATLPLLTALIQGLRTRNWPASHTVTAMLLALSGVVLVVSNGHPATLLASRSALGDAMILAGALCWAFYTLGARDFPHWSPLRYSAVTLLFGFGGIAVVCLMAFEAGATHVPSGADLATAWPHLLFMALGASIIAVLSWNSGVRRLGPVNGALFINVVPISTFAVEAIGGRMPSAWELAGGALVIAALLLNGLYRPRPVAMPRVCPDAA
ncbi:MAG: DMT family transporter [Rhodocyclaceae bacterium]